MALTYHQAVQQQQQQFGGGHGLAIQHARQQRRGRIVAVVFGGLLLGLGLGLLGAGLSKRASCPATGDRWDFDRSMCLSRAKMLYIPGSMLLGLSGCFLLVGCCAMYHARRRQGEQAFDAGFREAPVQQQPLMLAAGYMVPGLAPQQPAYGYDGRPAFHPQQPMQQQPMQTYEPPPQQYPHQQPPAGYIYGQHSVAAPPQGYQAPVPAGMGLPPAYAPQPMPSAYAPHVYTSDPAVAAQPEGVVAPPGGATSDES